MDFVVLAFYAIVCGLLALAAPWLTRALVRLAVGACVGLLASGILPALRGWLGFLGPFPPRPKHGNPG